LCLAQPPYPHSHGHLGSDISRWLDVLTQIGATVLMLGLSWNLKDITIDSAVGHRRVGQQPRGVGRASSGWCWRS